MEKIFIYLILFLPQYFFSSTLNIGIKADIRGTNPQLVTDGTSLSVLGNVFEPLVSFDEKGKKIVPCLALNWKSDEQFKKWTYILREGVLFHDGTTFDSYAVVKSFSNIRNLPFKVEAVEKNRVLITLEKPNSNFNQLLAQTYYFIISPKMIENKDLVSGTGPFIFSLWEKGKKIVLKKNLNYWRKLASIEEINFFVLGDEVKIIELLRNGEIDLADWVSGENILELKKIPNLMVETKIGNMCGFLNINTLKPPFNDKRIRKAIAAAINQEEMAKKYFKNLPGTPAKTLMPPSLFFYSSKLITNNLDYAKKLLQEANFESTKEFILLENFAPRPYMPDPHNTAIDIKNYLEKIGIKIKVERDPDNYGKRRREGSYDLVLNGWIADSGDPIDYIEKNLHSRNIGSTNGSWWKNEEFDKIIEDCKTLTGKDLEKKLREALSLLDEEVPLVPLFYGPYVSISNNKILNYTAHPFYQIWLYPAEFSK